MRVGVRAIIVGLCALLLIAGGAFAYWHMFLRGPLAGDTSFDFGEVPLTDGDSATLEHVLQLVNRLNEPVTINAVRPDCGCLTTLRDLRRTLAPGERIDLPITLSAKPGRRQVVIHLDLGPHGTQSLRVSALGKGQTRLTATSYTVELNDQGEGQLAFSALTYETEDAPPRPTIECHGPPCQAEFLGWTLGFRPPDLEKMPTEWRGRGLVRCSPGTESSVVIRLSPSKPLTFAVRPGAADSDPRSRP